MWLGALLLLHLAHHKAGRIVKLCSTFDWSTRPFKWILMCLHKISPHLTELTFNDDVMNIVTHNMYIRPIIHTLTWFQWNLISFTIEKENFWIFSMLKLMVKPYPVCSMEFWNCLIKCYWVKWLIIPAHTLMVFGSTLLVRK